MEGAVEVVALEGMDRWTSRFVCSSIILVSQEEQRHSPLMIRTSWRWKGEEEAGGTAGGAGAAAGLSIVVSALCSNFRLFKHILQVCSTERAGEGQQQQQHLYYCIM